MAASRLATLFSQRQLGAIKAIVVFVLGVAASGVLGVVWDRNTDYQLWVIGGALLIIACACIAFELAILGEIERLDERHRFRIDFHSAIETGQDHVHDQARAFLGKADLKGGCEIFAVNSYLEAGDSDKARGDTEKTDSIRRYYQKIEELAKQGAKYTRVVQLPTDVSFDEWMATAKPHYRDHYNKMLDLQDQLNHVRLVSAKQRFPLSFVLIANEKGHDYLIWQMDDQTPGDSLSKLHLHGIFTLEDPDRQVVNHFKWCFEELRSERVAAGVPAAATSATTPDS